MCLLRASLALPGHGALTVLEMLLRAEKSMPEQKFFPCPERSICMPCAAVNYLTPALIVVMIWNYSEIMKVDVHSQEPTTRTSSR